MSNFILKVLNIALNSILSVVRLMLILSAIVTIRPYIMPPESFSDAEVEQYRASFVADCLKYRQDDICKTLIPIRIQDHGIIGDSMFGLNGYSVTIPLILASGHKIVLVRERWDEMVPISRKMLVYHEMGHGVLRLDHSSVDDYSRANLCFDYPDATFCDSYIAPYSLMYPIEIEPTVLNYYQDLYIEELMLRNK